MFDKINEKYSCILNISHIECEKGWYVIIDTCLDLINHVLKECNSDHGFKICQIKEKFGGLRIYYDYNSCCENGDCFYEDIIKKIDDYIVFAETLSFRTCEFTGSTINVRSARKGGTEFGWIKTLCEEEAAKWEARN